MKKQEEGTSAIITAAKELLLKNRRKDSMYTYTIPSPYEYRHQWLWDSCFHAIVQRHFDTPAAESELQRLMTFQSGNGMVRHEEKTELWGGITLPFKSRVTQPPFIARAALDVYRKSRNREFLAWIFPKLQRYHSWLELEREADGVLRAVDSNETGEDNSVIWDDEYHLPVHRTYLRWFSTYLPFYPQLASVKSVTMTAAYADALESMAGIAGILGQKKLQLHYLNKNKAVVSAMPKAFRQADGLFHDLNHKNKPIMYKTHSIFSPLFAAAVTKNEAKKLVDEHLLNENEFWTNFPIPSVAVNEPKFSANGYWRGPMWININWMIHRGLLRYGFKAVAEELLQKTIAAVKKSGFREYYNPLTGGGLGAKQLGWSTLVADMILEK